MSRVTHIGICVRSLARSRAFYCGVFGFSPVRESFRMGTELDALTLVQGCDYEMQFFRKGEFLLELFDVRGPGTVGDGEIRPNNTVGDVHLTVEVDDLDAALGRVMELGGTVLAETRTSSASLGVGQEGELAFVFDPDGVRIELTTKLMRLE